MHLLILHGALGASSQFKELASQLSSKLSVHLLDFAGHGLNPTNSVPLSIEGLVQQTGKYLCDNQLTDVAIFGYSMGGYAGMLVANEHPERVSKVITLATKYEWTELIAEKETSFLNPTKMEQKVPAFAAQLQARHKNWREVVESTAAILRQLGAHNPLNASVLAQTNTRTLLLAGDRDKMLPMPETLAVYQHLPNAQLGILPKTGHAVEEADVALLTVLIEKFVMQ
jgi:pimeloyl-ACP methyl ester carboxylesterase